MGLLTDGTDGNPKEYLLALLSLLCWFPKNRYRKIENSPLQGGFPEKLTCTENSVGEIP